MKFLATLFLGFWASIFLSVLFLSLLDDIIFAF